MKKLIMLSVFGLMSTGMFANDLSIANESIKTERKAINYATVEIDQSISDAAVRVCWVLKCGGRITGYVYDCSYGEAMVIANFLCC